MSTFHFDIGVRRVGDPKSSPSATTLEFLISDLPAPVRALLALEQVDDQGKPATDAGRESVLRGVVAGVSAADGVAWDVRAIALGHLIDYRTGQWIYIPGGTLFELLEGDAPYQRQAWIAGREVTVAYEIAVRSS